MDVDGNLFIVDESNHRLRRVDAATGLITTVAGTGVVGFSGDGGRATGAAINAHDVVVDISGDLFFTDAPARIRRIDASSGVITTVAGTGTPGFSGDGAPAISAQLDGVQFITIGANGDLFFTDSSNHRIRRVDRVTGIITTIAGSGPTGESLGGFGGDEGLATNARLNRPQGIDIDADGNLAFADTLNHRIRTVNIATGIITTIAGTGVPGFSGDEGPATSEQLNTPGGIAFGANGSLFIADTNNQRIRVILRTPVEVDIDIKPGSFPKSINPRSRGKIPVAILTTDTFDAATVDPATVRFGKTGTEATPVHVAFEDVDGNGDMDMILHFDTQHTGIACGDTSASLLGETLSGQAIEGSDSIKTVGCK